jgi:pilus assembly protein Flp/PilA
MQHGLYQCMDQVPYKGTPLEGDLNQTDSKGAFRMIFLRTFRKDTRGATAIEYGLIAAGIAVAISAAVFALGVDLSNLFGTVSETVAPD